MPQRLLPNTLQERMAKNADRRVTLIKFYRFYPFTESEIKAICYIYKIH